MCVQSVYVHVFSCFEFLMRSELILDSPFIEWKIQSRKYLMHHVFDRLHYVLNLHMQEPTHQPTVNGLTYMCM